MRSRLFEPASVDSQAPAAKLVTYALLFVWTLVVLVPLYWVLITSFKGPGEVDNGPFYIPFVDFAPSLQAWDFMLLQNNTLGPYLEFCRRRAGEHFARRADRFAGRLCAGAHPLPGQTGCRGDLRDPARWR